MTQPGNHMVYLRPDLTFQHLQLTYHAERRTVTFNVTSDDLVMEEGSREGKRVREVKVLWDSNNDTIVVGCVQSRSKFPVVSHALSYRKIILRFTALQHQFLPLLHLYISFLLLSYFFRLPTFFSFNLLLHHL